MNMHYSLTEDHACVGNSDVSQYIRKESCLSQNKQGCVIYNPILFRFTAANCLCLYPGWWLISGIPETMESSCFVLIGFSTIQFGLVPSTMICTADLFPSLMNWDVFTGNHPHMTISARKDSVKAVLYIKPLTVIFIQLLSIQAMIVLV